MNKNKKLNYWLFLKWLSLRILFPSLLIGSICNQPGVPFEALLICRSFVWIGIVVTFIVIIAYLKRKRFILIIMSGFFLSKIGRLIVGDSSVFYMLYTVFLCSLFCFAGSVAAFKKPVLVYKQVVWFCLLSLPLMFMQLLGVGEWTQILRTDLHGEYGKVQAPTLFVGAEDVVLSTLQVRPAGFCWANNYLSFIILFALGLHFGIMKKRSLNMNDIVLCLISVLAMAKIVFLALLSISFWVLLFEDFDKKQRLIRFLALFFFLIVIYAVCFPGVFAYNTSWELLVMNFLMRYYDLIGAMKGQTATMLFKSVGESFTPADIGTGLGSGYGMIAKALPFLLVIGVISAPFFILGMKKLKKYSPGLSKIAAYCFMVLILMPLITSPLKGVLFWFVAGFAFLPLILLIEKKSFYVLSGDKL